MTLQLDCDVSGHDRSSNLQKTAGCKKGTGYVLHQNCIWEQNPTCVDQGETSPLETSHLDTSVVFSCPANMHSGCACIPYDTL